MECAVYSVTLKLAAKNVHSERLRLVSFITSAERAVEET